MVKEQLADGVDAPGRNVVAPNQAVDEGDGLCVGGPVLHLLNGRVQAQGGRDGVRQAIVDGVQVAFTERLFEVVEHLGLNHPIAAFEQGTADLFVGQKALLGVHDVLEQVLGGITAFEQLDQGGRLWPKRSRRCVFMKQREQGLPG